MRSRGVVCILFLLLAVLLSQAHPNSASRHPSRSRGISRGRSSSREPISASMCCVHNHSAMSLHARHVGSMTTGLRINISRRRTMYVKDPVSMDGKLDRKPVEPSIEETVVYTEPVFKNREYESMQLENENQQHCRAIEQRSDEDKGCELHPGLPQWCLPHFRALDAINVVAKAREYIHSLQKQKYDYLDKFMPNLTSAEREEPSQIRTPQRSRRRKTMFSYKHLAQMHYIQNKNNPMGMLVSRARGMKVWIPSRHYPPSDLPTMFNFTRCAVVGSAKYLLSQRRGQEIDEHDVIIRANQAPVKGYERFVGSRTDIRMTNTANAFFSEDGNKTTCLTPLISTRQGESIIKQVHQQVPSPPERCSLAFLSPQFESYRWVTFERLAKPGAKAKWSSGFAAIALAVNICQEVDIYGFSFKGNYYFRKVHNGNPIDKKTGKTKPVAKGYRVIYNAPDIPQDDDQEDPLP
mmetsp:Transcript_8410/g.24113  ORF Transcript_8410/g.24113 Transcript_8410/m.24113 type:complete len:465 (-) Transcript_8410:11-1405(-)